MEENTLSLSSMLQSLAAQRSMRSCSSGSEQKVWQPISR